MPTLRVRMSGVVWACVESAKNDGEVPTIGVDYTGAHSEQERDEEKGMPTIVA